MKSDFLECACCICPNCKSKIKGLKNQEEQKCPHCKHDFEIDLNVKVIN